MKTAFKRMRRKGSDYLNDGGNPALNFINTCKKDSKGRHLDLMQNYSTFLNWCQDVNLIDWDTWLELDSEQYCYEHEAALIYSQAISARNCFDELFNCLLSGTEVHPLVLDRFNGYAEKIYPHLHYGIGMHGPELFWDDIREEMNLPLWLVISYTYKLIDSGDWRKIKKCPICGSLFLDLSRSGNRRWCNPNTCGCVLKSKKYYAHKDRAQNDLKIA